jgi:hypothetical protein
MKLDAENLIGWTLDEARAFISETSPATTIRVVETAPPQRPARKLVSQNGKRKTPESKPPREKRWGEQRILRCRTEEIEAGVSVELTVAREELRAEMHENGAEAQ